MKKLLIIIFLSGALFLNHNASAQVTSSDSKVNIGLGMGLDYGGIGGRLTFVPAKNLALFGSLGYNFLEAGYNVGATFRMLPEKRVCPTLSAMYGYNAVIVIENADKYSKTYYGPSFSFGLEVKSRNKPNNFWNVELLVPLRSSEYHNDIDEIKDNDNIELKSEPLPIAISFGYHWGF